MASLLMVVAAGVVLLVGGRLYSSRIARWLGEDASRPTPAIARPDGRDFVATPTPVVFAHHFASIAGAGPIVGPVIAILYGWLPALLWVVFGGILIGAVHDYVATHMATREGGQSLAVVTRRVLGRDAHLAMTLFIALVLALVCATFLNLSADALTSKVLLDDLQLPAGQSLFRTAETPGGTAAIVGGIASMSVVCITACAPLLGWLYLKKNVNVWLCSAIAIGICVLSIAVGLLRPIAFDASTWKLLLAGYVLIAAGVPVWIFLQSRDFINVHILYAGMAALLLTLVVAGVRGQASPEPLPAVSIASGSAALGLFWPLMFITIACGAVSGFHSLCAGGTTCKQLTSEPAARRVGYFGMILESFLAVCVIAVLLLGATRSDHLRLIAPKVVGLQSAANPVLGFALAVGNAARLAWGVSSYVGTLAGMILLEGFLVTTLDTAVRLMRYLFEEIWRTMFARYDVFAAPVAAASAAEASEQPVGAGGLPAAVSDGPAAEPARRIARGPLRGLLLVLRQYWFNSALAVGLTLVLAMSGGARALWHIFAASNQLLAAFGLSLAGLWLLQRGRRCWYVFVPAAFMFATTLAALGMLLVNDYLPNARQKAPLLVTNLGLLALTAYLIVAGLRRWAIRRPAAAAAAVEA